VLVADATSANAPDEPALQALWPQPAAQRPGCGFPAVKLLGLLDLFTGVIVQLALTAMNVHEMSQLAGLHAALRPGDVLLADRGFCSFWHLAMIAAGPSVNAVFRMHQRQIVDFTPGRPHRTGKRKRGKRDKRRGGERRRGGRGLPTSRYVRRLGREDQLVEWARPEARPAWMDGATYARMPETLRVRELRYRIVARGRRTRVVTVATTLLDPVRYPKREVARLYGLRWEVETDFRHLKATLGMDRLKCRTADGVLKELMVFVLVYNVVRAAMARAAARQRVAANRVSFVDAVRLLRAAAAGRGRETPGASAAAAAAAAAAAGPPDLIVNPARPGRWHPRVIKRRVKPYDLLNRPRGDYAEPASAEEVTA
jgi:hypothetical protein